MALLELARGLEGAEAVIAAAAVPSASPDVAMEAPEPMPPLVATDGPEEPTIKKDRGEPLQPRSEDGTNQPLDIKLPLPDDPRFPPERVQSSAG